MSRSDLNISIGYSPILSFPANSARCLELYCYPRLTLLVYLVSAFVDPDSCLAADLKHRQISRRDRRARNGTCGVARPNKRCRSSPSDGLFPMSASPRAHTRTHTHLGPDSLYRHAEYGGDCLLPYADYFAR
ncbi:hypothetical protein LX36DRAFT_217770 [Colletotrichum falcatum]|nr:hypothetical protein LX36DRAFT_217770 [Colletotrichum falcatum]